MAECKNCLFGKITGSIGNLTFWCMNGKQFVRKKMKKGIKLSNLLNKGELSQYEIKRANANFIFSMLTYMTKKVSKGIIYPVWWKEVKGKRLKMSSGNLFFKRNFSLLYESLLDGKLCGCDNKPDLSKLVLSIGDLAPARIKNVRSHGGELLVEWEHTQWASPEDYAYIMAIEADFNNSDSWNKIEIWGDARTPVARREDGRAGVKFQMTNDGCQMSNREVYVYLFFSSSKVSHGFPRLPDYSVSDCVRLFL